mmetsp:Transcript_17953/g.46495  ORF Transcript_17953/g.46495 Transcript_17953/m.46495 type:complete len:203 (+) Transcript_17953:747-1355(+)
MPGGQSRPHHCRMRGPRPAGEAARTHEQSTCPTRFALLPSTRRCAGSGTPLHELHKSLSRRVRCRQHGHSNDQRLQSQQHCVPPNDIRRMHPPAQRHPRYRPPHQLYPALPHGMLSLHYSPKAWSNWLFHEARQVQLQGSQLNIGAALSPGLRRICSSAPQCPRCLLVCLSFSCSPYPRHVSLRLWRQHLAPMLPPPPHASS